MLLATSSGSGVTKGVGGRQGTLKVIDIYHLFESPASFTIHEEKFGGYEEGEGGRGGLQKDVHSCLRGNKEV